MVKKYGNGIKKYVEKKNLTPNTYDTFEYSIVVEYYINGMQELKELIVR